MVHEVEKAHEIEPGSRASSQLKSQVAAALTLVRTRSVTAAAWLREFVQDYATPLGVRLWETMANGPVARAISRSIRRRIILGNVFGLIILLIGWFVVSQQNTWLIDAKRTALETQSRIMAAAVAESSETDQDRNRQRLIDPDLMAEQTVDGDFDPRPLKDLDFMIRPEVAAPVVARLIEGTDTRVRIYEPGGTPVVDSNKFIDPDGLMRPEPFDANNPLTKPKNFWTRFLKFRLQSNLPVYQDIDDINGRSYPEVRKSLADGKAYSMLLMTGSGEQVVAISAPVVRKGSIHGVLMLSTRPGDIDDLLFSERMRMIAFTIIAFIATVAASVWLGRTVAGPLRKLSEAAEDVSADINASDALPSFASREDEIGQLSRSFEKMTTTLRTRLQASERFAADVAHELKNPLTAARSMAETLPLARTEEQRSELISEIQKELTRLNRLISDVSNAQRLDAELALQETHPVSLAKIAEGVVQIFQDILSSPKRGNVSVTLDCALAEQQTIVRGHDIRLGQVITNLVDNAGSFSPENGKVSIKIRAHGNNLHLIVEDEGPGIDPDQIDKIFNRFYTWRPTKQSSRGNNSGLGLSIAQEIVRAHNGDLWVENRRDRSGARFTVELPRVQALQRRRGDHRATRRS